MMFTKSPSLKNGTEFTISRELNFLCVSIKPVTNKHKYYLSKQGLKYPEGIEDFARISFVGNLNLYFHVAGYQVKPGIASSSSVTKGTVARKI